METGSAILHQEPKPVGAITQGIPPELEKLIRRCLRKDLDRRFQHIGDIRIALLELKEDLAAGPSDITPATPRQVASVRVLTGLAALVLIIATAVAGWYWFSRQRPAEPDAPLVAQPLTSYPGYEDCPSFSPDGNFVAFQWCGEAPGTNCDIWITQIGVEPPSQLTTDPAVEFSPAWSPNGLFIAFLRQLSPSKSAVIMVPRTGGQERVLGESDVTRQVITGGVETPFLAWTPDSKWLVIPTEESGPRGGVLSLLSVETREKRPLTISAAGSKYDAAPAFSPDGRSMTFVRWYGNRSDLYLLRLGMDYKPQREQPLSVSTEEPWTFSADWTPDESEILFSRSPGNLWRIPASGSGKPQKLAVATEHLSLVAVSRKGNRLAYSVPNSKSSIWHVDLKGPNQSPTAPLPLIRSTRNQYFPMYSRDGKRIAYDSDISGHPEIWTCNSDGSNALPLTSFGRNPRWAPDGRSIVFAARVADNMGIYIIGANGGSPRRLPVNGLQSWPWPFWSRDSQWIYFRSESSGSSEIWKTPVTGGDAVQITPNGHGRDQPLESPDGKFLYYLHADGFPEQCSVWRMPTEGGEETKVVDSTACLAYDVRDQGIFFFSRPDKQGRNDISFYDFFTGETRKILTGEHQRWSITVSPDGRTLVYVQEDQSGTDLMLVDNFR